jgi:hypothetical protein
LRMEALLSLSAPSPIGMSTYPSQFLAEMVRRAGCVNTQVVLCVERWSRSECLVVVVAGLSWLCATLSWEITSEAREFCEDVRQYNCALEFTSFSVRMTKMGTLSSHRSP